MCAAGLHKRRHQSIGHRTVEQRWFQAEVHIRGKFHASNDQIVDSGRWFLLASDGLPVHVSATHFVVKFCCSFFFGSLITICLCRCILFTNLVLVVVSAIFYTIKNNYRTSSEEELENSQKTSRNMSNTEMKKARQSLGTRILSSYCVKTNSSIITGHDLGSDSIPCIHGLRLVISYLGGWRHTFASGAHTSLTMHNFWNYISRALGMIWIICGHLFFYGPGAIDNVQMTLIYAEAWYLQPLFATAMSVDTYFVIRCRCRYAFIIIILLIIIICYFPVDSFYHIYSFKRRKSKRKSVRWLILRRVSSIVICGRSRDHRSLRRWWIITDDTNTFHITHA